MPAEAIQRDVEFLDPKTFGRLQNLELIAKYIVEGFMIGLHKSPYHGFSVEFSSYRKYSPGDNLKFVDWKLFGRTDRHYVKQFEENTNLNCYLLLDKSGSMVLEDEGMSKLRYGSCLSAAFAYLMLKQRDAVSLATFDSEGVIYVPPSAKNSQLLTVLSQLQGLEAQSGTDFTSGLNKVAARITHRGMIVLISDLLAEPQEILDVLKYFRYKKHEVVVIHVMSPQELDFPFNEQVEFEDAETGAKLVTSGRLIREEYLQELNAHFEELQKGCLNLEVDLLSLRTDEPLTDAFVSYLVKRQALL
ncbi:MAG: DUF58 domain-containing protein [Planctomycetota bacterium]|nr:DUF58 domain-containing protein [Planctomycetota bacterium]